MKNLVRVSLLALVFFITTASAAWSLKIGYFDYQTVLDKSKWGQKAMRQLESKQKALKGKVDIKAENFKKMKEDFNKKRSMLDQKALTGKLKELQIAQREGEKTLMDSSAELRKLENQLSAPITKKIVDIINAIAKKDKFDYIFEQRMSGLFYANPGDDLTNRVIKELDKVTPR